MRDAADVLVADAASARRTTPTHQACVVLHSLVLLPVAGEVLRAGGDAAALRAATNAAAWRATRSGSEPKAREPITGFAGAFTSATGARFQFTPTPANSDAIEAAIASSTARRRRLRAPRRPDTSCPFPLEPRNVAALLVDREQEVAAFRTERRRARRALAGRDVVGEEHDPSAAARQEAAHPVGHVHAWEAREEQAAASAELAHPRTAPRVSPKAIRRCTSRKKTITGTAVSVEAAISAPQSVCRLVPRKYESQTVTVCFDWSLSRTTAKMYSFQS